MKGRIPENGIVGPIKIVVPDEAYYLNFIRHALGMVLADLQIPDKSKTALILSLDEACSNVIRYREARPKLNSINITFRIKDDIVRLDIHNFCKLDKVGDVKTPECPNLCFGGMGIALIEKCVDKMEFLESSENMVDLRLSKRI